MKGRALLAAAGLAWLAAGAARAAEPDAIEKALAAELARSATELKAPDYPAPYFVSLSATDEESTELRCSMGALLFRGRSAQRTAVPDLHVGSRALDNHPVAPTGAFVGAWMPLDADVFATRHALWRLMDYTYKGAAAGFLRKQALRVSRGKAEYDTDDFSQETPRVRLMPRPASAWKPEALETLCREGSRAFTAAPDLLSGFLSANLRRQWTRLRDSEGSQVDFGRDFAEIELQAVALSTDGLRLFANRHFLVPVPEGLPSPEKLRGEAREMIADLKALQTAASTSPFGAPALLDPSVGAAVVYSIASRLSGEEQRNPSGSQTFRDKMGRRVLPPEFSLEDDPRLSAYGGVPLAGHYEYDDEGIPAQRASLIEKGVLKGLLLSRYPVIGFPRSNGHGRAYPGYEPDGSPGVLILRSGKPASSAELLERLRAECRKRGKPYGLWIKRLRSFAQNQRTGGQVSLRLLPGLLYLVEAATGKLTLVRDLDAVGTPLSLLSNILAAGTDSEAVNIKAGEPASVVVPSLLLSEVELQRAETRPEKPPILPPPSAP